MKLFLFYTIFLFCFWQNAFCQKIVTQGKVIKIIDGDTFDLLLKDNSTIRIRMNGIDCPEKGQPYYKNAKQGLAGFIFGKEVSIISTGKDRYKRTLADVYVGNDFINLKMIVAGFAWHFKKYSKNKTLAAAEVQAKSNNIGLWSLPSPVAPWDFRDAKKKKLLFNLSKTNWLSKNCSNISIMAFCRSPLW